MSGRVEINFRLNGARSSFLSIYTLYMIITQSSFRFLANICARMLLLLLISRPISLPSPFLFCLTCARAEIRRGLLYADT